MYATVGYTLSPIGQKASILAGGDGKQEQSFTVPNDAPEFTRIVATGDVDRDGSITLDTRYSYKWDTVPTVADILDRVEQDRAATIATAQRREAECRAATQAVLGARKTRTDHYGYGLYRVEFPVADWPYPRDESIITSPAALAWQVDLDAAKDSARSESERLKAEHEASEKAKVEAQNAANTAWRDLHGLTADDVCLRIEDGALAAVPSGCWESHKRGKNWLALIAVSPSSPGGLARDFAEKAKGESYYLLPTWKPGDAVEFGADYYSGGGRKNPTRWYGYYVREMTSTAESPAGSPTGTVYAVMRKCGTGKGACKEGEKWAKENAGEPSGNPVQDAIARVNSEGSLVAPPSVN